MEAEDFKKFAKEMVEYITNYLENIRERLVLFLIEKFLISFLFVAFFSSHGISRMFESLIDRKA